MDDFLLQVFFINPFIHFLINPGNILNKKFRHTGLVLSIVILFSAVVFVFNRDEKNYYEILDCNFGSSKQELHSNFKKLAIKYHPDKNPGEHAKDLYAEINEAHTILFDEDKKFRYDRFGDFSKKGDVGFENFWDLLFVMLVNVVVPLFFGLLYTINRDTFHYSKLFFCMLGLCFSSEIVLRFSNESNNFLNWIPFFGRLPPFEKIMVLQEFVPLSLNISILLASSADQAKSISNPRCLNAVLIKIQDTSETFLRRVAIIERKITTLIEKKKLKNSL